MNKIAALPEIKAQFLGLALRATTSTPEDLTTIMRADWDRYGKLIRELNLRLD
jgi:tripartite-type tricarboxylate transporter receptor subunit TctC